MALVHRSMDRGWLILPCALLASLVTTPGHAHHSVLGFDGSRAVVVAGTVREVIWTNPHTYIAIDGANGDSPGWLIESEGSTVLRRLGWTPDSVQPGYRIRSIGAPARDGRLVMRCEHVEVAGTRLPCMPAGPR